ncbi:MAG: 4Fe-4S binding protein [Treponemataceae bacterium]|nr:4Fe-4S binding protein [Treponemataceae bacterium]
MNGISDFHSVELRDENCKGCTICVTSCPVEAIRVHGGKAHILEKLCIDCGECIRKCPSHAKYALTTPLSELSNYKTKVALLAPAFFAQFSEQTPRQTIIEAVKLIGFDYAYDISGAAGEVSQATADFIRENKRTGEYEAPLISSSCPAILKLIQIRFPSLIEHILPIIPPSENAARKARLLHPEAGIFFISPCPAKVTVTRAPLGYAKSEINGVFSMNAVYLPVLQALKKVPPASQPEEEAVAGTDRTEITGTRGEKDLFPAHIQWCRAAGEAEALEAHLKQYGEDCRWLYADGLPQAVKILEETEDGQFDNFDFLEISACTGGCLGGPLTVTPAPAAASALRRSARNSSGKGKTRALMKSVTNISAQDALSKEEEAQTEHPQSFKELSFSEPIIPRPGRLLDTDFAAARKKMQQMEELVTQLGGLDCGSCGAPNCRALAEDIVRKQAVKEDCVIILKAQYEQMLFGKGGKNDGQDL